jgi:hypothetical protein
VREHRNEYCHRRYEVAKIVGTLLATNVYRGSFPLGKTRPGRDADHAPHPVPRSRMRMPLLVACMTVAGQLLLFIKEHRLRVFENRMLTK